MKIGREIILLISLFFIAGLICAVIPYLLGLEKKVFDLQLGTTYLVFSPVVLTPLVFLPLAFLVYLFKEWHYRYQREPQRIILLVLNGIMLLLLFYILSIGNVYNTFLYNMADLDEVNRSGFPLNIFILLALVLLASVITLAINPWKKRDME